MFESSWRSMAQNNIMGAIDLADSFGGNKNVYLIKLNQSLRRKIKSQKGEVPNVRVYQRLANVVDLCSYRNNHRKPDSGLVFREAEIRKLDNLRRKRATAGG